MPRSSELRAEGHFGNLDTMWIAVGQPKTGKSPSIRCAIDDPMKSLPAIQELIITSITAGGFSKALADKCPSISSTICTKLFSIDQFYCRLKNGIYPSKLKQTAIEMNKLIQICWICSTDWEHSFLIPMKKSRENTNLLPEPCCRKSIDPRDSKSFIRKIRPLCYILSVEVHARELISTGNCCRLWTILKGDGRGK